jgi:hypothetical protein
MTPCRIDLMKPGECKGCKHRLGANTMACGRGIGSAHHQNEHGSFCASCCPVHRSTETAQQKALVPQQKDESSRLNN